MQTQPGPGRGEGESWHAGVGVNLRTEAEGEDGMIQDGTGGGRGRVPQDPPREGEGGGQCDSLDCTFRRRENCLLGCRLDGGHKPLWLECLPGSVCHKPNSQSLKLMQLRGGTSGGDWAHGLSGDCRTLCQKKQDPTDVFAHTTVRVVLQQEILALAEHTLTPRPACGLAASRTSSSMRLCSLACFLALETEPSFCTCLMSVHHLGTFSAFGVFEVVSGYVARLALYAQPSCLSFQTSVHLYH